MEGQDESDVSKGSTGFTYAEMRRPRQSKPLRELPRLTRSALSLVWQSGRKETIALGVLSSVQALGVVLQLLLTGRLISRLSLLENGGSGTRLIPDIVAFSVILIVQGVAGMWLSEVRWVLGELVGRRAQSLVAKAAAQASLVDFERPSFHDRLQRCLANASSRPLQVATSLVTIVSSLVTSVALIVALGVVQPLILAAVLLGAGPLWIATRRATRIGYDFSVAESEADRRRAYLLFLLTAKPSAKEVRAYELAPHLSGLYDDLWEARISRVRALARRRASLGTIGRVVNGLVVGGVMGLLVWTITSGRAGLGTAVVAAGAVVLLGQRLASLIGATGSLYECSLFLADVETFLSEYQVRDSDVTELADCASENPLTVLEAKDIAFRYPSGNRDAIKGLSLVVRPGEMIALVGPNGSGKTTVAKVLAGLLPASEGAVLWNGTRMTVGDPNWSRSVAVMFQDFTQYMLTLGENVGFGRVAALLDQDRAEQAIGMAGLHDMSSKLRAGMATLLGPEFIGGTDLSGGQWQRVALARAFFRDAPVVILDEPSSALDPDAEAALFATVKELCRGRAVVVVSHRFSTVKDADRIYVMDDGAIIESGSHADLTDLNGTYARLFRLQASRYADD